MTEARRATCSVDSCERVVKARGWCNKHYQRWMSYGRLQTIGEMDVADRWASKVDKDGPIPDARPELGACWQWMGSLACEGYGRIRADGRDIFVHRWSFEHFVGPIPEGMQVDHLCRNRGCVNPHHLEIVDLVENVMRGESPQAVNARKTHCIRGHEFTPENTYVDAKGRSCRACRRERDHRRVEARHGA